MEHAAISHIVHLISPGKLRAVAEATTEKQHEHH